jgi:anthranilate phosphoribosyltransferase
MSYAQYIKQIGRGMNGARELPADDAERLCAAMLDGGVPELELGAVLLALRMKTESLSELLGFHQAQQDLEAKTAAAWIRKALQGGVALPLPIVNQLACCLYGSGYCADFNEAKAIIAVELRSPLVA